MQLIDDNYQMVLNVVDNPTKMTNLSSNVFNTGKHLFNTLQVMLTQLSISCIFLSVSVRLEVNWQTSSTQQLVPVGLRILNNIPLKPPNMIEDLRDRPRLSEKISEVAMAQSLSSAMMAYETRAAAYYTMPGSWGRGLHVSRNANSKQHSWNYNKSAKSYIGVGGVTYQKSSSTVWPFHSHNAVGHIKGWTVPELTDEGEGEAGDFRLHPRVFDVRRPHCLATYYRSELNSELGVWT